MKKNEREDYVHRDLPVIRNNHLLQVARGEKSSRIPVWLMRQAGRYLPEYLEFSRDKDFFSVCRNPEWACEITLQPIRRFDLDAAIIFSDILVLPQSLGWDFIMVPSQGPKCTNPLRERSDAGCVLNAIAKFLPEEKGRNLIDLFKRQDTQFFDALDECSDFSLCEDIVKHSLRFVYEAIHHTRKALNGKVPLIGFAGAPWTLFTYITEGGSSKLYAHAKRWLYSESKLSHCLFRLLAGCAAAFLIRQIDAGASIVQVFESHGGELPPDLFKTFCAPYLALIAKTVKKHRPGTLMILFCKGRLDHTLGGPELYDVLSLDTKQSLSEVAKLANGRFSLQGNLETAALHAPEMELERLVTKMLESVINPADPYSNIPARYIANLGHGVTPDISPRAVEKFVEIVHSFKNTRYRNIE